MFTGAVATLLVHDGVKPVGRLSRSDVLEIRAVVMQSKAPRWSWFTRANLRYWPSLVRMRLTFRIFDIREDSIGTVTIHPDGTREVSRPVIVRFRAQGWSGDTCRVEKKNGRWVAAQVTKKSHTPLILFLQMSGLRSETKMTGQAASGNWVAALGTNAPCDTVLIQDPEATNSARFYGAVVVP